MARQATVNVGAPVLPETRDPSDRTAQERAIRQVFERMPPIWASGDAATLAAAWSLDCDHINLSRVRQVKHGRAMLEQAWHEAFERRTAGYSRSMNVKLTAIRFLKADVAVVDGSINYGAGIGAGGRHQPATSEPFTSVMLRYEHEWLIVASRVGPTLPVTKFVEVSALDPIPTSAA